MPLIMSSIMIREPPGGATQLVTGGANEAKFLYPKKDPLD